jgi:hypothetical protein
VYVEDAAGNITLVNPNDDSLTIPSTVTGSSTQTLTVGNTSSSSSSSSGTGGSTTNTGATNGVQGVIGTTVPICNSPRLSVRLAQTRNAIVTKTKFTKSGALILVRNHRYGFTGKLTCEVNGKRVAAAVDTVVRILNVRKGHTTVKTGASIASGGVLSVILAYPTNRTLVFRYQVSAALAQVKFRLDIVKPKKGSHT